MEQHPIERGELQATPPPERSTDEQLIYYGITEALREERPIDHATVRAIASQLHGGQRSPLYALASSGALVEGLRAELDGWREDNETGVEVEPWLDALDEYLDGREDPAPVDGWHQLWPTPPERQDDEPDDEAVRASLMARISDAGVTTLGQVATVHAAPTEDEHDDFPWTDAAQWNPTEVARDNYEEPRHSPDELDALFGEQPDEQVGSVGELGWYGRIKHADKPGGLILIQDEQGFRHVRKATDDEALNVQWTTIQQEYEKFYEQRDAYYEATADSSEAASGHNPRIWVGSLADYNDGRLHGVWMDATLEPDELRAATEFMLRNGYTPGAEEWAIMDYEEFGGYKVEEYASFTSVSRIARGVAEHGPAFAEWVDLVGEQSEEQLTDEYFRDHYEGEWDSLEDYVEYVLSETGFNAELERALAGIPEDLRHYVKVDVEGIGEDWAQGLHVVETDGGKVYVFDARA